MTIIHAIKTVMSSIVTIKYNKRNHVFFGGVISFKR